MSPTVSNDSASAAELETPHSMDEAMGTGFLPEDQHYRLTGEFKKEKDDTSAAATATATKEEKETTTPSEKEGDETAAASAAAQSQSTEEKKIGTVKTAATSESRWAKLSRENRELKTKLAEKETTQQTTRETAQPSQAATESKAAPKPKIDDVDATGKPKFKTYADYEDAKDSWLRQETIREFNETNAKTAQLTQQQQAEREIGQSLVKKFEPLRAKYADFDTVALGEHLVIPKGSVAELFILDSDHAGEVLYYLGQHPEITNGFYANHDPKTGKFTSLITPQRQFRKLMEIEAKFTGANLRELSGETVQSSTTSAKPITQASRPPHQVSGQGTVSKDAVEQALDDGDFETYSRAQNAKELARRKK